jgi:hypothetical protein
LSAAWAVSREPMYARRSFGGRRGIVWTHVKGHAGHPGNEWADILADVGRMQPFTSGSGDDKEVYCKQFPYEQDEYEEGDTAQHFATAISDLHGDFLRTVLAASSPTSGDVLPTTSSSSEFATPAMHPTQLNLSGGDRRGAGHGAPGVTPGASATGDDLVFIQHHDEREDVGVGDGLPGDLPGASMALAIHRVSKSLTRGRTLA